MYCGSGRAWWAMSISNDAVEKLSDQYRLPIETSV